MVSLCASYYSQALLTDSYINSHARWFLPRDAMRIKHGLCCRTVSVCPSVTLVHCILTAEDIKLLSWPGSIVILVF